MPGTPNSLGACTISRQEGWISRQEGWIPRQEGWIWQNGHELSLDADRPECRYAYFYFGRVDEDMTDVRDLIGLLETAADPRRDLNPYPNASRDRDPNPNQTNTMS